MIKNRRKRLEELLNRIRLEGSTSLEDLSRYFGVSTATIRRDVKHLEQEQSVVQTVGGGILYRQPQTGNAETVDTQTANIEEKIRIAEKCTELVEDQDEIIVGPGSTAFIVGRILTGIADRRFRIITNSLELALEASGVSNIETVVLGGEVHGRYSAGFTAHDEYFDSAHRRHKLLLSVDGIDLEQGLTIFDPKFLRVLERMLAVSSTVILASDSTKIGRVSFNRIGGVEIVSTLVTDSGAPEAVREALGSRGVTVLTV
ncbi:MAG: DeoR/GlpR family DNA-binding transcription regulator [Spirochaetaceae bacterium]